VATIPRVPTSEYRGEHQLAFDQVNDLLKLQTYTTKSAGNWFWLAPTVAPAAKFAAPATV
jgi:hypothetical protein